jgi:UDP-N-acetyl-D-mannosaminuronic acid dehydrogenase
MAKAASQPQAEPKVGEGPGSRVAIFGLGFVGLPLALSYAMAGSQVYGVDIQEGLVREIQAGRSYHRESYQGQTLEEILQEQLKARRFLATLDGAYAVSQADTVIVTVGVPLRGIEPDPTPLLAALRTVGSALRPGQVVILRSTVVPGTTEELALPTLEEASGLKEGQDFYLAYCPERIAEGRAFEEFRTMPIILGALSPQGARLAQEALARVTQAPIAVTDSVRAAELSKVVENVQRDVNIAIVQELAAVCEAAGLDTREVIALANTHTRVHLLDPGPGVGGYCVPVALHYLRPYAQRHGVTLPTLEAARLTNEHVPQRVVERVKAHLRHEGLDPRSCRVAVWGLAMKDYTNDLRASPAAEIARQLAAMGCSVTVYDPAVPPDHPFGKASSPLEACQGAHVLLVLARQQGMDFQDPAPLEALAPGALVVDTRGVFRGRRSFLQSLGLIYWAI